MKTMKLLWILLAAATARGAGGLEIVSLTSNGRLTFTNSYPNGLYTVEWASASLTNWSHDWRQVQSLSASGESVTVEVPMVYRVKCVTNLAFPLPMGAQFVQSASHAVGQVWTNRGTVVGRLCLPAAGDTFTFLPLTFDASPYNSTLVPMLTRMNILPSSMN